MYKPSIHERLIFVPGHGCYCPSRKRFLGKIDLYEDAIKYMSRPKAELHAEMMWLMPFHMDSTLEPELGQKIHTRIMPVLMKLGLTSNFGEMAQEFRDSN